MPGVEHRRHKGLNNRAENSHQPTRWRERQVYEQGDPPHPHRRDPPLSSVDMVVGEQLWEGRGVVRAVYPRLLIVTHEDIPGLLPARTTGFRLADTVDRGRTRAGDSVRFWLRGAGQEAPSS